MADICSLCFCPFLPSWLLLQVTNLRHDLENMMEDLDKWPHLISENRQSCDLLVQSAWVTWLYPCDPYIHTYTMYTQIIPNHVYDMRDWCEWHIVACDRYSPTDWSICPRWINGDSSTPSIAVALQSLRRLTAACGAGIEGGDHRRSRHCWDMQVPVLQLGSLQSEF